MLVFLDELSVRDCCWVMCCLFCGCYFVMGEFYVFCIFLNWLLVGFLCCVVFCFGVFGRFVLCCWLVGFCYFWLLCYCLWRVFRLFFVGLV